MLYIKFFEYVRARNKKNELPAEYILQWFQFISMVILLAVNFLFSVEMLVEV